MPFSSQPAVATHTGNGSSTTLTIPWLYLAKSHVVVKQRTAADTALTTLTEGVDYTLTAAGDENGGTLTFTTAPASGYKTYAWLTGISAIQETRRKDGDARLAATFNQDLDRIWQFLAVLDERTKRSWRLPLADTGSDMEGVIEKATLLGKLLRANATTGKIEGVSESEVMPGETTLPLSVANGGTGSGSAAGAVSNLGAVPTTRTLTAGLGLSGGGDLSSDRSFALSPTELTTVTLATGDKIVIADASDSENPKVALASDIPNTLKASEAQMEAAAVDTAVLTPLNAKWHPGVAKCWGYVTYSGGVPTLQASHNITSISDDGTGDLGITIATDHSDANYSVWATHSQSTIANSAMEDSDDRAVGSFTILVCNFSVAAVDPVAVSFGTMGSI